MYILYMRKMQGPLNTVDKLPHDDHVIDASMRVVLCFVLDTTMSLSLSLKRLWISTILPVTCIML